MQKLYDSTDEQLSSCVQVENKAPTSMSDYTNRKRSKSLKIGSCEQAESNAPSSLIEHTQKK